MAGMEIKKDYDGEYIIIYNNRKIIRELLELLPKYKRIMFRNLQFNDSLDSLPDHITHIIIDSTMFNQKLNKLPENLKVLIIISADFNQELTNLPQITHLHIGGTCFQQNLEGLPESLECLYLTIASHYKYKIIDNLPNNLKIIYVNNNTYKFNDEPDDSDVIFNFILSYNTLLPKVNEGNTILYTNNKRYIKSNAIINEKKFNRDLEKMFKKEYNLHLYTNLYY